MKIVEFPERQEKNTYLTINFQQGFATTYDRLVCDATPTEAFDNFLRDISKKIYQAGYEKGLQDRQDQQDGKGQWERNAIIHLHRPGPDGE